MAVRKTEATRETPSSALMSMRQKITPEQGLAEGWYKPNTNGGLCMCGCGSAAPVTEATSRSGGVIAGEPKRFIVGHSSRGKTGSQNARWKGGRHVNPSGYVYVRSEGHPKARAPKYYIAEHRLVMEAHLGRILDRHETVHHKNGIRGDNRIENLELHVGQHGKGSTHCGQCSASLTPPVAPSAPVAIAGESDTIPEGYCQCGCGEETELASKTVSRRGVRKGEPKRFVRGHAQRGANHPLWKGGRRLREDGYIELKRPDHPRAGVRGYVMEHRVVMEDYIGRLLTSEETVHHKNAVRDDNRIENLELRTGNHGPGATHCWQCDGSLMEVAGWS